MKVRELLESEEPTGTYKLPYKLSTMLRTPSKQKPCGWYDISDEQAATKLCADYKIILIYYFNDSDCGGHVFACLTDVPSNISDAKFKQLFKVAELPDNWYKECVSSENDIRTIINNMKEYNISDKLVVLVFLSFYEWITNEQKTVSNDFEE